MVVQVWTPTPLGAPATQRTREPKSHPRATFKHRLRERACCHLFGVAWKWKTLSCCCNTEKRKMLPANKRKREHRKFPSCFMWRGGGFISQEVKSSSTAAGSVLGNSSCCGALGTGIAFGRRTPFAAKSISARVTSDSGLPTFTCYQKIRNQFKRLPNSPRLIFPLGWHNTIRGLFLQLAVHFSDFSSI